MLRRKVLVVDDNPSMRELLRLHLSDAGFEVDVAEDAIVAGMQILRGERPDVLVVDVNLPYFNGVDFVATLQADLTLPHMPVILITGQEAPRRAYMLEATVLRKPFRVEDLVRAVEQATVASSAVPVRAAAPAGRLALV